MKELVFLAPAQSELAETVAYYNTQSEGLGFEFALEVRNTLERIVQFPKAWPLFSQRAHRCRTNRFPYGILYQLRADCILIVAVMHLHADPKSWKSRVAHRT